MFTGCRREHHLKAEASQKVTEKSAKAARGTNFKQSTQGWILRIQKFREGLDLWFLIHFFSAERIISCQGTHENSGISLTKRDFRLQKGILAYKTGISFTKWDSWSTSGTLGLLFTEVTNLNSIMLLEID